MPGTAPDGSVVMRPVAVRMRRLAACPVRLLAASLLLAGVIGGVAPVTASAAGAAVRAPATFSISGGLSGVAATSASNAWAVGYTGSDTSQKTLILHWNGTAWKRVTSPSPAGGASLSRVVATSANNAWAIGGTGSDKILILRWNGTAWKQVPIPNLPSYSTISAIAATSASNAWAVGSIGNNKTLILRWNGTAWKQVSSPSPLASYLTGVAATSASNAWAVGYTGVGTLILHWNGRKWTRVSSPIPGSRSVPVPSVGGTLIGVTAISAASAWVVGTTGDCGCGNGDSVILRWNGTAWKQVPSPTPAGGGRKDGAALGSVAATSADSAWAVGVSGCGCEPDTTWPFIVRWNGTAWKQVPSAIQSVGAFLSAVAATSASNAWAVGSASGGKTLIEHWNGTAWKLS
jgi:hypothetical protein